MLKPKHPWEPRPSGRPKVSATSPTLIPCRVYSGGWIKLSLDHVWTAISGHLLCMMWWPSRPAATSGAYQQRWSTANPHKSEPKFRPPTIIVFLSHTPWTEVALQMSSLNVKDIITLVSVSDQCGRLFGRLEKVWGHQSAGRPRTLDRDTLDANVSYCLSLLLLTYDFSVPWGVYRATTGHSSYWNARSAAGDL